MKEITKDQVVELFEFLQGNNPDNILMGKRNHPKMNREKAFKVIWFLQEHLRILPDTIEMCSVCKDLYDTWQEGFYDDKKYKHYCNGCIDLASPKARGW